MRLTILFFLLATASSALATPRDLVVLPEKIEQGATVSISGHGWPHKGRKVTPTDALKLCYALLDGQTFIMRGDGFNCRGKGRPGVRAHVPLSIMMLEITIGDKLKITWSPTSYSVTVIGGSLCKPKEGKDPCLWWMAEMSTLKAAAYQACIKRNGKHGCSLPSPITIEQCPCGKKDLR